MRLFLFVQLPRSRRTCNTVRNPGSSHVPSRASRHRCRNTHSLPSNRGRPGESSHTYCSTRNQPPSHARSFGLRRTCCIARNSSSSCASPSTSPHTCCIVRNPSSSRDLHSASCHNDRTCNRSIGEIQRRMTVSSVLIPSFVNNIVPYFCINFVNIVGPIEICLLSRSAFAAYPFDRVWTPCSSGMLIVSMAL